MVELVLYMYISRTYVDVYQIVILGAKSIHVERAEAIHRKTFAFSYS